MQDANKTGQKIIKIEAGHSILEYVKSREYIAAKIDGTLHDLSETFRSDREAILIPAESEEGLAILRHSAAHLLAQAVTEIYPDALPNAGPPTDDGFYYDFRMKPIGMEDLSVVEERMHSIVSKKLKIIKKVLPKNDLLKLFSHNKYKIDKIKDNVKDGASSTIYEQGEYVDFCRGPHVPDTSYIKAFKLLSIASTNYKGDVKLESMVRIYGTAFPDDKSLKLFLKNREEAAKRDHRKIGAEMDLFVFNSERAPGLPLYTSNGAFIRNQLIEFMRGMNRENGWQEVCTPHLFRDTMWKQSGHYAKYKDDMFLFKLADGDEYALKPMNCPGHITIYENSSHSYRDLPVKLSEFGTVYRYEKSGEVGGLSRPRTFTIDDGHAFLRPDQIEEEIGRTLDMITRSMGIMLSGWPVSFDLSLMDKNHPESYLLQYKCANCGHIIEPVRKSANASDMQCPECNSQNLEPDFSVWDSATEQLRSALLSRNITFKEFEGEAAFYGPKIDVHVKDAFGRSWQLSTLQLDFNMPRSFDLYYVNSESKHETPVMLHRAIFGSLERLIVILLESYAGKLPSWLSPLQVYLIPVSESYTEYARNIEATLRSNGINCILDQSPETVGKKIKLIRSKRPAYICVVGENEVNNKTITVRNRKDAQTTLKIQEFVGKILMEIRERKIDQMI